MSTTPIIWIGMDVHKDTVMVAVFEDRSREPEIVKQLPNEDHGVGLRLRDHRAVADPGPAG